MKLNKIQVLSKQEIDNIHVASLQLFENVGIKIDDEKARNLCQEYGAIVDKDSKRVKFPESMIKEQLRNVPSSFALHGPDGTFKVDIDVNATFFTTIGAAVKMYDHTRKSGVRKSTLDDNLKNLRLVDMADNLSCSQIDFWPGDVKYTTIHAHAWMNWVKNSRKP
jgi:trimethylamine--corrinoid protein Co-methyltransferase